MQRTVLSLFDHTGNWSKPWEQAGYKVVRVDLKDGGDVLDITASWLKELGNVWCVLAAPPCTDFAVSGARWFKEKDADGRTKKSIRLVYKTLAIIRYLDPPVWALENPVGRIGTLVGCLGKPKMYFNPNEYALLAECPEREQYTKKTCLWGRFRPPSRSLWSLDPVLGSYMHRLPPTKDRAELRSVTPTGFARAFFIYNGLGEIYGIHSF